MDGCNGEGIRTRQCIYISPVFGHTRPKQGRKKKEKDVRKEKEKKTERKGAPLFEKRESIWNVRFSGAKMLSYKISNPLVWRSHHFMAAQGFGRREGRCDIRTWGDVSFLWNIKLNSLSRTMNVSHVGNMTVSMLSPPVSFGPRWMLK